MLAKSLLTKPMDLIVGSVSQVYYQAASEAIHKGAGNLLAIYKSTVKKLIIIGILPAIIVTTLSPSLVKLIFGEKWIVSGIFM